MKIKLIKDFPYSLKGYDYNYGKAGDEVELTPDLVRMAKEVGAYVEPEEEPEEEEPEEVEELEEEPEVVQKPVKWLPNGKPASTKGKK